MAFLVRTTETEMLIKDAISFSVENGFVCFYLTNGKPSPTFIPYHVITYMEARHLDPTPNQPKEL